MSKGDIVIVDDNLDNLTLLAGILRGEGYQVRIAKSGVKALELVSFKPPELMMLDIQMPEIDGYEVCRRLKSDQGKQAFPIIFISALGDTVDKVRGFQAGCVDYVTKPFQAEEVLARVATQLEIYRLRRDLEARNAELARRNAELMVAHQRTNRVFQAFAEALPGTVLNDKYRLDMKIGAGGFGVVFRATHLALERAVAVKVFRPIPGNDSDESLEKFRLEGVAASRLVHPNAVEVFDFGISSNGIAYIVMELLRGFTLEETLKNKSVLPLSRAVEIVLPVCRVLAEAHAAGIIHRDIKPSNVFLHQTKHGEVVKVLDFGIAKFSENADGSHGGVDINNSRSLIGTDDYMSPERFLQERYDGRADVFSVGIMLYQMLTGRLPYKSDSPLKRLMEDLIPIEALLPTISPRAQSAIMSALAQEPDRRPTARELADNLSSLLNIERAGEPRFVNQ